MINLIQLPEYQEEWLIYFLESSLLMGLALIYFRVMLLPARNWVVNRIYLLAAPLIGMLLPLINWATLIGGSSEFIPTITLEGLDIIALGQTTYSTAFDWLAMIYAVGVGILLLRMLIHLTKIYQLTRHFRRHKRDGYTLVEVSADISTSSFGPYIFWSPKADWNPQQLDQVLAHEICHVRQRHTADLIFMECLMIVAWFQPLLWLYRSAIRQNHEFLADQAAMKQTDPKTYAHMLLAEVFGQPLSLVHSFFHSPISKRIKMLHPTSGLRKARFKAWLAMPILALGMIAVSCTVEEPAAVASTVIKNSPQSSEAAMLDDQPKPLNMVELQKTIGYPQSARDAGTEGLVVLRILVDTDGSYLRHEVVKGNDLPVLVDAIEAEIKGIKFNPAKKEGEQVQAWVNIPFNFKLID